MKKLVIVTAFLVFAGCESESFDQAYDRGYNDGYAAGYNTTCEIRATMIAGDWDIDGYKSGYDSGYSDGSEQCKVDEPQFR
jgi:flagellar biosynthesis/type III secretory pathway protein FliH